MSPYKEARPATPEEAAYTGKGRNPNPLLEAVKALIGDRKPAIIPVEDEPERAVEKLRATLRAALIRNNLQVTTRILYDDSKNPTGIVFSPKENKRKRG